MTLERSLDVFLAVASLVLLPIMVFHLWFVWSIPAAPAAYLTWALIIYTVVAAAMIIDKSRK